MPLPPVRAVSLCVAAALAFIAAQARADAASSAVRVNLESVDSLDIKRAQADDAASFASAERMEGSLADELELIGNAKCVEAALCSRLTASPIDMTLMK